MIDDFSQALEPKEIELNGIKFIIRKMPCTVAQEVLIRMPQGLVPILANYSVTEEMAFKMLSYCDRIYSDGRVVKLINKDIINNNIPDFKTLMELEKTCMEYNFGFFDFGGIVLSLEKLLSRAESSLSKMLMDSLDKLLQAEKQPSEN